ncbi:SecY interacting protein Syd [Brevibacillus laterosporus]|uniref:SecY-interacting protein Syd n=1 Tax=Brevibacillus laterosporus TaxID=1465 RepID=UPI000BD0C7C5|nr:SecY-interacting protein Syd [Brevibacillus laterosporus]PCN42166.1 SecY interacting protein Syd [Brevibacillus laterosporus]
MKKIMDQYFERFKKKWKEYNNTLPQIAWNEEVAPFIYRGEKDEYGYISWLPIEKGTITNFKEFEINAGAELHQSLKQYFNSFWFLELAGWIGTHNINLYPVVPGIEPEKFLSGLNAFAETKGGIFNYIPIGFESNGMLVVVDNNTGSVYIEDFETEEYEKLSNSIEDLISQLRFRNEDQ